MDKNSSIIWDGQGPVMIGRYDPTNGTPDMGYLVDLYRIGCGTSSLATSLSIEKKQVKETCTGQRLALKERVTAKTLEVSLSMIQFSGRTLAAAFYGTAEDVVGSTVTAEQLPALQPGDYFTLRHPRVSSVVIQDSTSAAALTYVEGTHYVIEDEDHARFQLLEHPAGHIEPLLVDYEYDEYTNIAAFSQSEVERGLIFNGVNGDGQKGRVIIPRVSLAMGGDFSWITDDEATLQLSGQALFVTEMESDEDYGGFMRISLIGKA
jgi:hypothetical protein